MASAPSLDIPGTSGTEWLPDGPEDYEHRGRVADELETTWPRRARALRECGNNGVRFSCKSCGAPSVFPYRCSGRTCPNCARRAASVIVERVEQRLALFDLLGSGQQWEGPGPEQVRGYKLLTLTTRASGDLSARFEPVQLRNSVRRMRGFFREFWRASVWGRQIRDPLTGSKRSRRDTAFVLALEVSPHGMVHLHVLVYGEFVPQLLLQSQWSTVVGDLAIVDVRAVRPDNLLGAIDYTLKYTLKGDSGGRPDPARAAAVELALKHTRRVEIGGALRHATSQPDRSRSGEDTSTADLSDARGAACEVCATIGCWAWDGHLSPKQVAAFGGFSGRPGADGTAVSNSDARTASAEALPRVS